MHISSDSKWYALSPFKKLWKILEVYPFFLLILGPSSYICFHGSLNCLKTSYEDFDPVYSMSLWFQYVEICQNLVCH